MLVALGASVLIGVFASQLASETWDSVLEEVEAEKKSKIAAQNATGVEEDDDADDVTRQFFGWQLPEWMVGLQYSIQEAEITINDLIDDEYQARVWNATKTEPPPANLDPAKQPDSPEIVFANQGIDYGVGFCESLVLSPQLFQTFIKYADPLYDQAKDEGWGEREERRRAAKPDDTELLRNEMLRNIDSLKSQVNDRLAKLEAYTTSEE